MNKINQSIKDLRELSKIIGRGNITYNGIISTIQNATDTIENQLKINKKNYSIEIDLAAKKIADNIIDVAFKKYLDGLISKMLDDVSIKEFLDE